MASIRRRSTAKGLRYDVRYRDPSGGFRTQTFDKKAKADDFAATVEADMLRGVFIDPAAGKTTLATYAWKWLEAQTFDRSTHDGVEIRLRLHILPVLGSRELRSIKPSAIQSWLRGLDALAPRYRQVIFANLSTILSAAVDDEIIPKNPCRAPSVTKPRAVRHKVIPWPLERVPAVREALPSRYRVLVTLAFGLGLRQGECFGLGVDDIDWLRGTVEIRRQVKLIGGQWKVFAPPKGQKARTVPLPASVRDELAAHLAQYPSIDVELPYGEPGCDPRGARLVVTSREAGALDRGYINSRIWKPALVEAGVEPTRDNGMHALRHLYASVLLDGGESIMAVSEYLGHADPGFTLRTYTHLMPSSDARTRKLIDAAYGRLAHDPRDQGGQVISLEHGGA